MEREIGEQIHQQILSSFYVYTDEAVVRYLNEVSGKLTRHARRQELAYRVTLLYSDKIYATSAPGGYIYITTAMLDFLKSEAELAAVLGHEIGRLQYQDPTLSEARKALQQVSQAGAMVSSAFGPIGMLAALGFVAMNAVSMPAAWSPEKQLITADALALYYLMEEALDPQAMRDIFNRFMNLPQNELVFYYDYYQARPLSQVRMDAFEANYADLALAGKTLETGYRTYQDKIQTVHEIYRR